MRWKQESQTFGRFPVRCCRYCCEYNGNSSLRFDYRELLLSVSTYSAVYMGSVLREEASLKYFCPTVNIRCIWEDKRAEMNLIGDTVNVYVGIRFLGGTKIVLFYTVSTPVLSFTETPILRVKGELYRR
jgi:hypothetical protein